MKLCYVMISSSTEYSFLAHKIHEAALSEVM